MGLDYFTRGLCNAIAHAWGFDPDRRREWQVWGAKHQTCPTCSVPQDALCVNLSDVRRGVPPRNTKWPHEDRVDWTRVLSGLKERGYHSIGIERQVKAEWDARQQGLTLEPVVMENAEIDSPDDEMPDWAKE